MPKVNFQDTNVDKSPSILLCVSIVEPLCQDPDNGTIFTTGGTGDVPLLCCQHFF